MISLWHVQAITEADIITARMRARLKQSSLKIARTRRSKVEAILCTQAAARRSVHSIRMTRQQWMRVLMGARPLLRKKRHRTMITPVNHPRLSSFILARVTREFIVRLELFWNM